MPRGTTTHRPVWDGTKVARDMMRAGLSQRQLAKKAKVTEATVSRLINGSGVSAPKVQRVATALGHDLPRYLDGVDVELPPPPNQLSA